MNKRQSSVGNLLVSSNVQKTPDSLETSSQSTLSSVSFSRRKARMNAFDFLSSISTNAVDCFTADDDESSSGCSLLVNTVPALNGSSTGDALQTPSEPVVAMSFDCSELAVTVSSPGSSPPANALQSSLFQGCDDPVDDSEIDVLQYETVYEVECDVIQSDSNSRFSAVNLEEPDCADSTASTGLAAGCGLFLLGDVESVSVQGAIEDLAERSTVDLNDTSTSSTDVWTLDGVPSKPSVEVRCNVDYEDSSTDIECQCGGQLRDSTNIVVICQRCFSQQHAQCVNYDLCDPLRGTYLCPHCHVVEVNVTYFTTTDKFSQSCAEF